jgi:hypothetical protein
MATAAAMTILVLVNLNPLPLCRALGPDAGEDTPRPDRSLTEAGRLTDGP